MSSQPDDPGETLDVLWSQVLSNWEDDQVHRAFLESAAIYNRLAVAATRYRAELENEGHRAQSEAQLARITTQALSMLEASRTPPSNNRRVLTWLAFAVSLSLVLASIFAMTR